MANIIADSVQLFYQLLSKADEKFINSGWEDLLAYEEDLTEACRKAVAAHIQAHFDEVDAMLKNSSARSGRFSIQRSCERTLVTTVGTVTFHHTQYLDKETGKYRFLADEVLRLDPHERMSELAETRILQEAVQSSYSKAAKVLGEDTAVSKETVKEKVHGAEWDIQFIPQRVKRLLNISSSRRMRTISIAR